MQEKFLEWLNEQRNTVFLRVVFPDNSIYTYSYNKWRNAKTDDFISNDDFKVLVNKIKL